MKILVLAGLLTLIGCASSPVPKIYVLNGPADATPGVHAEDGKPLVELRSVGVPDYLDSSDIFLRDGRNELKSSQTGRWGERLSVGVTHALRASLSRRLPSLNFINTRLSGRPGRMLQVDVDAFDTRSDGRCVLTAHWSIVGDDRQTVTRAERGTFVAMIPGGGVTDAAIVAAMEDAVNQLANRIASDLGGNYPRRTP